MHDTTTIGRNLIDLGLLTLTITNLTLMLAIQKAGWVTLFAFLFVTFGTMLFLHRYMDRIAPHINDDWK